MQLATMQDQRSVNEAAREFQNPIRGKPLSPEEQVFALRTALRLANEKGDRLQKAAMAAQMHLQLGDIKRAYQILTQALTS